MDAWLKATLPDALAYASSLLGQRDLGEDVVQDCAYRLLKHADRYDLPRDGRKLLFRAIHNASINLRLRRKRHLSLDAQGQCDDAGVRHVIGDDCEQPAEAAMTEELRQAIRDGLARLTPQYRSVLELASLGYRPMEIADILELDSGRVRLLLSRARKAMAAWLNARSLTEG